MKNILKRRSVQLVVTAIVCGYIGLVAGYSMNLPENQSNATVAASQTPRVYSPEELLAQANKLRADAGIPPLALDERLNESAQLKADDMKTNNYFGHSNPTTGRHGNKYILDKMTCSYINENLIEGDVGLEPFEKTDGWPSSPAHNAELLSQRYDTTGFGYTSFNGKGYYVQHFCDI